MERNEAKADDDEEDGADGSDGITWRRLLPSGFFLSEAELGHKVKAGVRVVLAAEDVFRVVVLGGVSAGSISGYRLTSADLMGKGVGLMSKWAELVDFVVVWREELKEKISDTSTDLESSFSIFN